MHDLPDLDNFHSNVTYVTSICDEDAGATTCNEGMASVSKDKDDSYKSYANKTFDISGVGTTASLSSSEGSNVTDVTSLEFCVKDNGITIHNGNTEIMAKGKGQVDKSYANEASDITGADIAASMSKGVAEELSIEHDNISSMEISPIPNDDQPMHKNIASLMLERAAYYLSNPPSFA